VVTAQVPRYMLTQSQNLHSVSLIHKPGSVVSESEVLVNRTLRGRVCNVGGP
jgi:hypothetical protein